MPRKKKNAPPAPPKQTRKQTPRRPPKKKAGPGRRPAETPDWAPAFLEAVMGGMHVRDACRAANVSGKMPYQRRLTDEAFKTAWADASELGEQELVAEATRRAFHGVERKVRYKGIVVGKARDYSDVLIMFLLRSKNPAKYRDNARFEHSGPNGGPIPVTNVPDPRAAFNIPDAEFRALSPNEKLRVLKRSLEIPSPN
jgi:hypothetical protein